jgi:hypothetical protein
MLNKVTLNPPPSNIDDFKHYSWRAWFVSVFNRIAPGPFAIQGYSVATVPDPAEWGAISDSQFSSLIFVYNEAGGPVPAFSDGTNWRRVTDRAIVS